MITTSNITMQFGVKPLFEKVSVKFGEGNRYGLIGANGSGKSTFMKILGGDLEQTAGEVAIENGLRLGKLRQDQFGYEDQRVIDVVMMGHTEMWAAMSERDAIYANLEATEDDYMRAADLEAKFAEYDGYTAEARAGELLMGVGIPVEQHFGPMSEVAPGWKLRVLLAQALFSNPDILLLDEPTNNLDINTIRWLEHVLNERNSTMIIISHDRHFLNSVCTHMADLDYNTIRIYPGNYDDYMIASAQARERQLSSNSKAKERIQELQEFVARFSANKSKARQATSRLKQVDKLKSEMVEVKPSSRQNPFIRFEMDDKFKLHRQAVEVEGLSKAYDNKVLFKDLNLILEAGARLAIIGPNGAGKTSLIKLLAGAFEPAYAEGLTADRGTIKWAEKAQIGYFAQDHEADFDSDATLTEWMREWGQEGDDEQVIRGTLGRLLFGGDEVGKPVRVLSGGEKGRMLYGKLILQKPNVMIMDEPTNHMDMESIESLNMALEKYKGTLIFVSHDRQFVSSLATHVLELDGKGGYDYYTGNYEDYLASKGLE
ncbi:ABC-F family ATPase [Chromobacterium violaceum]|uniref:Probable ATP-binding protein YbiT n=3 Tax=Chromobacterium violaceum TaxID=536 RepID=Q7NS50_CHRVO|nr:ABC-F family ATPase [Chromobacterium violaceum]AAQ61239.1 probable ABC transporter ATP-binding protein [Chromobacterium violaceum ATCC 12472]ATP29860.1 ABC-F family ATPase [Chromobacterium violaceum]ATP33766.1 ABC-F family ATPase [Chromobacterium violaceum]KJH68544.1 ABC transporter ATP-binding protein [Chromobacterium violaceum]MBA8734480.1 ABC-F family ATPase [Chromobacterium violaceum]